MKIGSAGFFTPLSLFCSCSPFPFRRGRGRGWGHPKENTMPILPITIADLKPAAGTAADRHGV